MIQVPGALLARFETCLAAKNISDNLRVHYKKWLRFYLDFCSKYHRDANKAESLADFQQKLLKKKTNGKATEAGGTGNLPVSRSWSSECV
jgi:hypothetical protein